jgi:hypothetical protein
MRDSGIAGHRYWAQIARAKRTGNAEDWTRAWFHAQLLEISVIV